jgi:hypothetical protein
LDNNPTESQEIYLAFLCAEYPSGSFGLSHIRMIHETQKFGYIKDLQVTGSGPNAEWQTDERLATTAHGIAQLSISVALMSREDSAKPVPIKEE